MTPLRDGCQATPDTRDYPAQGRSATGPSEGAADAGGRQRHLRRRQARDRSDVAGPGVRGAAQLPRRRPQLLLDRPAAAEPGRDRGGLQGVRPARARRRGHGHRSPATEVRALRGDDLRGPPAGALHRPGGGRRARRGAPVPRLRLRDHRPARRGTRPRRGASPPGGRPRAPRARPRRGAVRGAGQGRRRLRAGPRRPAERHRPDRGAGLRRRSRARPRGSTSSPAR